jgi:hypothetical protein
MSCSHRLRIRRTCGGRVWVGGHGAGWEGESGGWGGFVGGVRRARGFFSLFGLEAFQYSRNSVGVIRIGSLEGGGVGSIFGDGLQFEDFEIQDAACVLNAFEESDGGVEVLEVGWNGFGKGWVK